MRGIEYLVVLAVLGCSSASDQELEGSAGAVPAEGEGHADPGAGGSGGQDTSAGVGAAAFPATGGGTVSASASGGTGSESGGATSSGDAATGGPAPLTGGTTSASGGAASATGGTVPATGGTASATGGAPSATGGAPLATGGATSASGGAASGTGGSVSATGGVASTGGAVSATGGVTAATGGSVSTGGAVSATGGTTAIGPATPLSDYERTAGPITLDAISSDGSGVTWKPETDTFFVVANTIHLLYEYDAGFGTLLRTISLDNGPTDTEDVAYLGEDRFAVVVEDNEVYVVTIDSAATSVDLSAGTVERYVVSAPPAEVNYGFEGVTLRPDVGASGQFIVCQEGGGSVPIRVLMFERSSSAGTFSYADGTLVVDEPWDAATELGQVAIDLSSVCFDSASNTLLVLSQESSRLLRVVPETGEVLDQLDLSGSPQYEGVTLADGNRLVLVSEPNFVEIYRNN